MAVKEALRDARPDPWSHLVTGNATLAEDTSSAAQRACDNIYIISSSHLFKPFRTQWSISVSLNTMLFVRSYKIYSGISRKNLKSNVIRTFRLMIHGGCHIGLMLFL